MDVDVLVSSPHFLTSITELPPTLMSVPPHPFGHLLVVRLLTTADVRGGAQ